MQLSLEPGHQMCGIHIIINPLPALMYQNVLDLNVACQAKRTQNILARMYI
jgi:hypothetical protein